MKHLFSSLLIFTVFLLSSCVKEELPEIANLPPSVIDFFTTENADFLRPQSALVTYFNADYRNIRVEFDSDYESLDDRQKGAIQGVRITSDYGHSLLIPVIDDFFIIRTVPVNNTYCFYMAFELNSGVSSTNSAAYCVLVD